MRAVPIAIGAFALLIAILAAAGFGAHLEGERRWHAALDRVDALEARLEEPLARTPLLGPAIDGDAWPHYDTALAALPVDAHKRWHAWRWKDAPDTTRVALIADCRDTLAALARGARSTRVAFRAECVDATSLRTARTLANVALATDDVVPHAIAVLQYGADLAASPFVIDAMIGRALLSNLGIGLARRLARCDDASLARLASALERVDRWTTERPVRLDGEAIAFARLAGTGEYRATFRDTWRFGFSDEWMAADHVDRLVDTGTAFAALASRPWVDAGPAIDALGRTYEQSENWLTRGMAGIVHMERTRRRTIARLRMLRIAVDVLRGLDAPPLVDPFGNEIACDITPDAIRLSIGIPRSDGYHFLVVPFATAEQF